MTKVTEPMDQLGSQFYIFFRQSVFEYDVYAKLLEVLGDNVPAYFVTHYAIRNGIDRSSIVLKEHP